MDILNIDEVLEANSSCLFDEDNQEDVKNILQQWKQKMRDTISKPDTRTFTRVKQKINNSDFYYNKFDQENKEIDFDVRKRSFDYNSTFNQQSEPYETLLSDISPPVSSGFTDGNINQLNKSLIISNYHGTINDLNDSIDNDATNIVTDTERTFRNNSIINNDHDHINDKDINEMKPNCSSNNEIFDILTISGIKDFNIAQIDELSQLDFSYPNSNTESNDNDLLSIQNSKENISDIEDDFLLGKTLELKSNYHDKLLASNSSKSNDSNISSTTTSNSAFSDKTFTKRSKQYNTMILNENCVDPHNNDNNDFVDNDYNDDNEDLKTFNVNEISNEFNPDDSKVWKIKNDENVSAGIIHSTPFRKPLAKSNEINRVTKEKRNLINKNLGTNKNDYNNYDDLDIENYDIEKQNKLKLSMDLENEDETEEYLKNEEIANYQQNDVVVDDVDVDDYDDYKEEININAVKMKQSLDNIKKRHFSQKHDKIKLTSDTLNSTKILGTITNTNRLLSRRSRLYENLDTINFETNNLGSSSNNSSISSSSSNCNNMLKKVKENKNVSTVEEYNKSDGENDKSPAIVKKMNRDESKNLGQFKIPQSKDKNIQKQYKHVEMPDNNKKLETNIMNETFSKHSIDAENPKEVTTTAVKNKYRDNRVIPKPRYMSQYFRQTAENFQKANSAGDLNRTIILDEKHNGKIDGTCNVVQSNSINTKTTTIGNKAKSLHNLASNITLADDKYSEMKIKKPEFNFKQPATLHYDINKIRKNSSDAICDSTAASVSTANRPSAVPYRTRLVRPSSGYYSNSDIKTPLTGLMQNLSVNDSSDTRKTEIDKTNLNSINNSELNNHNKIETITTASNNPQLTFIKPATKTIRRSGLPRPSINIKR